MATQNPGMTLRTAGPKWHYVRSIFNATGQKENSLSLDDGELD